MNEQQKSTMGIREHLTQQATGNRSKKELPPPKFNMYGTVVISTRDIYGCLCAATAHIIRIVCDGMGWKYRVEYTIDDLGTPSCYRTWVTEGECFATVKECHDYNKAMIARPNPPTQPAGSNTATSGGKDQPKPEGYGVPKFKVGQQVVYTETGGDGLRYGVCGKVTRVVCDENGWRYSVLKTYGAYFLGSKPVNTHTTYLNESELFNNWGHWRSNERKKEKPQEPTQPGTEFKPGQMVAFSLDGKLYPGRVAKGLEKCAKGNEYYCVTPTCDSLDWKKIAPHHGLYIMRDKVLPYHFFTFTQLLQLGLGFIHKLIRI